MGPKACGLRAANVPVPWDDCADQARVVKHGDVVGDCDERDAVSTIPHCVEPRLVVLAALVNDGRRVHQARDKPAGFGGVGGVNSEELVTREDDGLACRHRSFLSCLQVVEEKMRVWNALGQNAACLLTTIPTAIDEDLIARTCNGSPSLMSIFRALQCPAGGGILAAATSRPPPPTWLPPSKPLSFSAVDPWSGEGRYRYAMAAQVATYAVAYMPTARAAILRTEGRRRANPPP